MVVLLLAVVSLHVDLSSTGDTILDNRFRETGAKVVSRDGNVGTGGSEGHATTPIPATTRARTGGTNKVPVVFVYTVPVKKCLVGTSRGYF